MQMIRRSLRDREQKMLRGCLKILAGGRKVLRGYLKSLEQKVLRGCQKNLRGSWAGRGTLPASCASKGRECREGT